MYYRLLSNNGSSYILLIAQLDSLFSYRENILSSFEGQTPRDKCYQHPAPPGTYTGRCQKDPQLIIR